MTAEEYIRHLEELEGEACDIMCSDSILKAGRDLLGSLKRRLNADIQAKPIKNNDIAVLIEKKYSFGYKDQPQTPAIDKNMVNDYQLAEDGVYVVIGIANNESARKLEELDSTQLNRFYAQPNEIATYATEVVMMISERIINALKGTDATKNIN